jgi:tetratricopeptide (TPR) repeat protein
MTSTPARFILFSFLFLFFIPHHISAETKTFIKEYTYQASEDDSRNSSRVTAMREVKRLLLEELGTYLESVTEVKNFQLTKDQITSLTAGIVKTEIVNEKWDGHTYWIKTKIVTDENDVIKSIDNLRKDRDKSRELEDTKKRVDAILEENKKLREELTLAKGNAKQQVQQRYDKSIKELSAFEWLESGYKNHMQGDFKAAIADYTKAIELNPKFDLAYNNRGITYHILGKYNEALVEYSKSIELNPQNADAYLNGGMTYHALGKYNEALVQYNKSIELNPQNAYAYECRGMAYHALGKYNEERVEYNKANQLKLK